MVIHLLNKMLQDGTLDTLVQAGLMSPKVMGYHEIYMEYDICRRIKKMKSMDARYQVSVKMKCDISTVHRAIAALESKDKERKKEK